METFPICDDKPETHGNVDLVRRRLLKLAVYSVPAILTVSFLPVEKAFAEGGGTGSPKTPKTPKTPKEPKEKVSTEPKTPKEPKEPKTPTTPTTQVPPNPPTTTSEPKSPKTATAGTNTSPVDSSTQTSASLGGNNRADVWQLWVEFLRRTGFIR